MRSKAADNHCTEFNREAAAQIAKLPRDVRVLIANRYSANVKGPNEGISKLWGYRYTDISPEAAAADPYGTYSARVTDTLCSIAETHHVYALAPVPEIGRNVPKTMLQAAMTGHAIASVDLPLADYHARNDVVLAALEQTHKRCGVTVLDPTPYLCDANQCHGARDGIPLYSDDNHLSESGNKVLVPLFKTLH